MSTSAIAQLGMPSTYVRLMARTTDTRRLLAGTGLTPATLTEERPITVAQQLACIRNSVAMMDRPDWHLAWSRRVAERFHGPISLAQLSAPTLGDGIDVFARFMPTRVPYLAWRTRQDADTFRLAVSPRIPLAELGPILVEIPLLSLACYVRTVHPGDTRAPRLAFTHAPLVAPEVYRRWFDFEFAFGAPHNAVSIPSRWRNLSNVGCDRALWQAALRQCAAAGDNAGGGRDIDALVTSALYAGFTGAGGGDAPSLDATAARLNVSARTLSRRLAAAGTSFGALLDRVRGEIARDMLAAGSPIGEIADALGYATTASFDRAYRRWHGHAPRRSAGKRHTPPPQAGSA